MVEIEHVAEHKVLKPILCFPGGKSKLARILMSGQYIPKHRVYVEPFFGGGSVFFAKPLAEVNVINDIDEQLISFYREFRELPKFDCDMTPDEKRFYDLKERLKNREHLEPCDYQYLNRWSVNCKIESFSRKKRPTCKSPEKMRTCGIATLLRDFDEYKYKLNRAIILNKDFREVIREYDSPETFFFIDPPYFARDFPGARECHYRMYGGCEVTPEEVRDAVKDIKGKFMITYPNTPQIREIFKDFVITEARWRYTSGSRLLHAAPVVTELLITNYDLPMHE